MKKKISRRRFVTSSALAAGAIIITLAIIEGQGIGSKPAQKALSSYDAKVRELLSQMTLGREDRPNDPSRAGRTKRYQRY